MSSEMPPMSPAQSEMFRKRFEACQKGGFILGQDAPAIFASFKLPKDKLAQIWTRVDVNRKGKLELPAFCQACVLAAAAVREREQLLERQAQEKEQEQERASATGLSQTEAENGNGLIASPSTKTQVSVAENSFTEPTANNDDSSNNSNDNSVIGSSNNVSSPSSSSIRSSPVVKFTKPSVIITSEKAAALSVLQAAKRSALSPKTAHDDEESDVIVAPSPSSSSSSLSLTSSAFISPAHSPLPSPQPPSPSATFSPSLKPLLSSPALTPSASTPTHTSLLTPSSSTPDKNAALAQLQAAKLAVSASSSSNQKSPAHAKISIPLAPSPRLSVAGSTSGGSSKDWMLTQQDLANYKIEFQKLSKNGFVPSADIPSMFAVFGLDLATNKKIWSLCDRNQSKGKGLGPLEFIAAMHLLNGVAKRGLPLPETLPVELRAPGIFAARNNQAPVDLSTPMTSLQKRFRGKVGRVRARQTVLWHTLKELERQEELKLTAEQKYYVTLREKYAQHIGKSVNDVAQIPNIIERLKTRISRIAVTLEQRVKRFEAKNVGLISGVIPLKPDTVLTAEYVKTMLRSFQEGYILGYESVWQLLQRASFLLGKQRNVVEVTLSEATRINIVGDIHGQLDDFLTVMNTAGFPDEHNFILFNGDFVDRGANSCECVLTMFALKLVFPNYVFLNRGNHEAADVNVLNGFEKEVLSKYDRAIFELFSDTFACLPLAHVVQNKVFVVHAGLSWSDFTMQDVLKINRFTINLPLGSLMSDMLWSDPSNKPGRVDSKRGTGVQFGPDICKNFLDTMGFEMIIRSHECVDGTETWFDGKLTTVFSASNYCGDTGNIGAFIVMDAKQKIEVKAYQAEKLCVRREPASSALSPTAALLEQKKEAVSASVTKHRLQQNITNKLSELITANSAALVTHYTAISGGSKFITRVQWAEGLRSVLGVGAPFLYLSKELGLAAKHGEPVDFLTFLARFDPSCLKEPESRIVHSSQVFSFLKKQMKKLEALFRSFDEEQRGSVKVADFQEAVIDLLTLLNRDFEEAVVKEACAMVDLDGNGEIEYEELSLRGLRKVAMAANRRSFDGDASQKAAAGLAVLAHKYSRHASPSRSPR